MVNMNEAIDLVDNGYVDKGIAYLEKISKHCSDEEKYTIAQQYYRWGFLEKAKAIVEPLLSLYPNEGELAIFYAELLLDLDELDEAIELLENVSRTDHAYLQSLLLQADLYQMQGLFEVSEQKLLLAKSTHPQEPIINLGLAELYFSQGEYKKSIPYYQNVLIINDSLSGINIYSRLAEAISASGEFEEAMPYYQKAIERSEDAYSLYGYGVTAYHAGYYETAIDLFSRLKEIDPEYSSLYPYLAKAYEHENLFVESYAAITEGLKMDDLNKEYLLYAGKMAMKMGDSNKAELHLRDAIAIDPGFIEAAIMLTKLLLHQERYEDVVDCIEEIYRFGEHDHQLEWDLGLAKNKLEQYSDALKHYQHAYTFFKDDVNFLEEYGYFLLEDGDRETALQIFKQLLQLEPSHLDAAELLLQLENN